MYRGSRIIEDQRMFLDMELKGTHSIIPARSGERAAAGYSSNSMFTEYVYH